MIREAELPGVGKKFTFPIKKDHDLIVVIYHSGKREIYAVEGDSEPVCVAELTDDQAKELGFVLAGAPYQPLPSEKIELIMREMIMEWIGISGDSPFVGKTIAQLDVRKRTGASIIALVRGTHIVPSPDPHREIIQKGDVMVVVGTRQHINNLLSLCGRCTV